MSARNYQHPQASSPDAETLLQSLLMSPLSRSALPRSHTNGRPDFDATALLQSLLITPVPALAHRRPVVLLSSGARHDIKLHGRSQRDRFDVVLARVQRGLLVLSLVALGGWAALGPVGDWLHRRYAQPASYATARQNGVALSAPNRQVTLPLAPRDRSTDPAGERAKLDKPAATLEEDSRAPSQTFDSRDLSANLRAEGANLNKAPATFEENFLAPSQKSDAAPVVDLPPQPNHLIIPSIGVDTPVVEVYYVEESWQVAEYAAGYLTGTGLPGDVGNVVFAGHAGILGSVFANIHALAPNDDIFVDAAGWRYHYRVRKTLVVWPTESEYMLPTDIPTMTLITCTNWDLQRVVVIADLLDSRPL